MMTHNNNFPISLSHDKEVRHFEISEHPQHDDERRKYRCAKHPAYLSE